MGKKKGTAYGFVQFSSPADAKAAFDAAQDLEVAGHPITVLFAKRTAEKEEEKKKKKAEKRKIQNEKKLASKKPKVVKDNKKAEDEENKENDEDDNSEEEEDAEKEEVEEDNDENENDEEDDSDGDDADDTIKEGLANGVTKTNLKEMFPKCSNTDIPVRGKKKGTAYGFVQFSSPADAKAAFDAAQDLEVAGHPITVLFAKRTAEKEE